MTVTDYFEAENREYWRGEIAKGDWRAAAYLAEIIDTDRLKEMCGENVKVFLLTEGEKLISFCTYSERDNIPDTSLKPWIGFVYTFPEFRGKRMMGKLFEYIYGIAGKEGREAIYISTHDEGIYEKYGFLFMNLMKDDEGEDSRIYKKEIRTPDLSNCN